MARRPRGFTLIEVLVVVVIAAVMTGFALLALGRGGPAEANERSLARVEAAVFFMDWSDQQINRTTQLENYVDNAAKSTISGFEAGTHERELRDKARERRQSGKRQRREQKEHRKYG